MMATTTKPVNLYQLAQEVGGSPSFHASGSLRESGVEKTVTSSGVSDADLQAALDVHTADWSVAPESGETEQDRADREFRASVEAAGSWQDLQAALLGTVGPGAQARRPS